MIGRIYFYDGCIDDLDMSKFSSDEFIYKSTSNYGFSKELEYVKYLRNSSYSAALLTNNPFYIHTDFVNTYDIDDIYLYNFKEKKFMPIRSFTKRELRIGHNLSKMWIGGAFPDAKFPNTDDMKYALHVK